MEDCVAKAEEKLKQAKQNFEEEIRKIKADMEDEVKEKNVLQRSLHMKDEEIMRKERELRLMLRQQEERKKKFMEMAKNF